MIEPLAHSARPKDGIRAQPYAEHVGKVMKWARENAAEAAKFSPRNGERLVRGVALASEFHDLGKLDERNQTVLRSGSGKGGLPINHVDAGVAHLIGSEVNNLLAATTVYGHHAYRPYGGLPDFPNERNSPQGRVLRDCQVGEGGESIKDITDNRLADYLEVHASVAEAIRRNDSNDLLNKEGRLSPLLFRIALSCLVDADHYDTARHYNRALPRQGPALRAGKRLAALDDYVAQLSSGKSDDRTRTRQAMYGACRDVAFAERMVCCDSPVGSGKTTAVMAHLLKVAHQRGLRRVFVVLPFTNIIDQSVEIYRKSLLLEGEKHSEVVAAHHHRAEFDDAGSRQFSFLWHAPVVVTTAVQFFETLASSRPAALRKLHRLPGSAVFVDEAHAALPVHLWPQAWKWIRELESEWGCHFVLGSGSLNRFWELEEFSKPPIELRDIVREDVKKEIAAFERTRVRYRSRPELLSLEGLLEWLPELPGPRLLIVNTVQSAAAIARAIEGRFGRDRIEHLSTALTPFHRRLTLKRIKSRLARLQEGRKFRGEDSFEDADWTVVATSCLETGVDLSFRTGLRERCSLMSLIQIGGRISRSAEYEQAEVWDFQIRCDGLLRAHPAFETSSRILGEMLVEERVSPSDCTEAMKREVRQDGPGKVVERLLRAEGNYVFPEVERLFKVIDSKTVTAVADRRLRRLLEAGRAVKPQMIQSRTVQIWDNRAHEWGVKEFVGFAGLNVWTLIYDDFLGYMAGVLKLIDAQCKGMAPA